MVPFFSTRYVDTFRVFDVNRAISTYIYGPELVGSGSGAGGILGLSVGFLGSTTKSQKSKHDSRSGMSSTPTFILGGQTPTQPAAVKCSSIYLPMSSGTTLYVYIYTKF